MKRSKSLQINILGELELRRGSERLDLPPSKKARALLAYLVVTGRPQRRDRLCRLLWDIADDPRGALRWCLSKLRPLVDEPGAVRIVGDRESIGFEAQGAGIDLFRVRAGAAAGVDRLSVEVLADLAGTFRGEFLEGLELPDYHDFQAWCVGQREDARTLQITLLRTLVTRLEDDAEAALPYAQLLVQADPLDDAARAGLARLLHRSGRSREALHQIETGHRILADLRESRSPELDAAASDIAAAPLPPREEPVPRPGEPLPADPHPPFVGRKKECDRLVALMETAASARMAQGILLLGEPGVGKTRLLSELALEVQKRGGTVLTGRSYEAEGRRPYGAWIDALAMLPRSRIGNTLEPSLAPLLSGGGTPPDASTRERLFAATVELVAALAHSRPPVFLVFDDVHWCDEASAELLHYMIRSSRRRPVLIGLTARTGELADNEPVRRVLRGLRRDGLLQELRVPPLTREQIRELVQELAPSVPDAERIFEDSGGNALYALELVRSGPDRDRELPGTLAELVRDRIDRLSPTAAEAVRWGAVLGTNLSGERLARLLALEAGEAASMFELLEQHGVIRPGPAGGGTYVFAHDLVRRAVYDDLSEPRRRLMHGRLARLLSETGPIDPATAGELVHHAALAGESGLAARACVEAGRHCLRVFANGEAYALARIGMGHAEALADREQVEVLIDLHDVSLSARRPSGIEAVAAELETLAERALHLGASGHARLGFHMLSHLRWEEGNWSDARRQSLRAEQVARSGDDRQQVVGMAEAARCLALLGRDLDRAEALVLEARARADREGIEAMAIPDTLGMLRFHQGQLEEAAGFFRQARDLAAAAGEPTVEFQALEHQVILELERGDLDEAARLAEDLTALGGKIREGSEAPFARALRALVARERGEDRESDFESAVSAIRFADAKHRLSYALARAARLDLESGTLDRARERAEEALRLADTLGRPTERAMARVVLARIARETGSETEWARHREALAGESARMVAVPVLRSIEALDTTPTRTVGKGPA